jgi:hypothetical protein
MAKCGVQVHDKLNDQTTIISSHTWDADSSSIMTDKDNILKTLKAKLDTFQILPVTEVRLIRLATG